MASTREIKRRIRSVTNIQQITKAMKMVAAARLRRAEERALGTRPYAGRISALLQEIVSTTEGLEHPLLEQREVNRTAYLIIGADKGLAGGYTSNLMKEAVSYLQGRDQAEFDLVTVGRRPGEYLTHRGYTVKDRYFGFSDRPTYEHARQLAKQMSEMFINREVDEVVVVYTHFYSALRQKPQQQTVLPFMPQDGEGETAAVQTEEAIPYEFLPDVKQVFETLLPQYLEIVIYNALLQAAASELGSRMAAMTSATDNASDLIDDLTLHYNKARQAAITNEISEIVGGANALE